jgi:hypothetical protein
MKNRDILKQFKQLKRNRKTRELFKLLPALTFILTSVLFLFPLPVPTAAGGCNTPSMNNTNTGYGLHSPHYKPDVTFSPSASWVLPAVSCFLSFYFLKNYFVISRLFPQYRPVSSGIRAPPHHAPFAR